MFSLSYSVCLCLSFDQNGRDELTTATDTELLSEGLMWDGKIVPSTFALLCRPFLVPMIPLALVTRFTRSPSTFNQ